MNTANPNPPRSPVLYVLVRKDIYIPPGKMAAQVAHASVRLIMSAIERSDPLLDSYFDETKGNEAKIVLSIPNEQDIVDLGQECIKLGYPYEIIVDAGYTVFDGLTTTCIGIGPITREQSVFLKRYRLFK